MTIIIENLRKELSLNDFTKNSEDKNTLKIWKENLETKKIKLDDECRFFLRNIFKKETLKISKIVDFSIKDWQ